MPGYDDWVTVSPVSQGGDALDRIRRENQTLYAVIKTVSSSLALERVLDGVVEIATDATGCHACFVYFLEGRSARPAGRLARVRPPCRRAPVGAR